MANEIKLKIKVDDDGNLKIVAKNAEKAAAGLEKTSTSANTADRRLKGAAQASANSTKNFAKLTQATGGLVGAYATLAASLFAVSAAYNFLKRAGDLTTLEAGQKAYAASTGTALRSLTSDIIDATDSQVTFRDAAQAAAIGTAAGLGADQLVRLGKAAKDTSIILGRDVTDSFNRLVRGVTKAEPELLDELGIILRLETATKKYAASIGKNAKDLTAFERSQAVANEVLEQSEEKYSKILEITGASGNEFAKLGKAFDDVVIKLQKIAAAVAGPLAKVLTETPQLAFAAFGLLLNGPLKALGVSFKDIRKNAKSSAEAASKNFEAVAEKAKIASTNAEGARKNFKGLAASIKTAGGSAKFLDKISEGKALAPLEKARLDKALKAAKANVNQFGMVTKGVFKGVKLSMVTEFEQGFKLVSLAEDKKLSKTKIWGAQMKLAYGGVALAVKSIGSALATGLSVALSWLGWVTLAYTAFQILNDKFGFFNKELTDAEKKLNKTTDKLKEVNSELENFLELQVAIADVDGSFKAFGNIGAAFNNISNAQLDTAIAQLGNYNDKLRQNAEIEKQISESKSRSPRGGRSYTGVVGQAQEFTESETQSNQFFERLVGTAAALKKEFGVTTLSIEAFETAFENFRKGIKDADKELKRTAAGLQNLDRINKEVKRTTEDSRNAYDAFISSLTKTSRGQSALDSISQNLKILEEQKEELSVPFKFGVSGSVENQIALNNINAQIKAEKEKAKIVKKFEAARIKRQKDLLQVNNSLIKVRSQELPGTRALVDVENKRTLNQAKQNDIRAQIVEVYDRIKDTGGSITESDKQQLALLGEQLGTLKLKDQVLEDEEKTTARIKDARNEIFKLSTSNTLLGAQQSLLAIDQKRLSISKEILSTSEKFAQDSFDASLLRREQENPFSFLDQQRAEAEARYSLEQALIKDKQAAIITERDIKLQSIKLEYALLDAKYQQTQDDLRILAEDPRTSGKDKASLNDTIAAIAEARTGLPKLEEDARRLINIGAKAGLSSLSLNLARLEDTKNSLSDMGQITDTLSQSFGNNFVSAIDGVIQGTTNLKDAFKNMAKGVLQALSQVIAKLIAIKLLNVGLGLFGGGSGAIPTNVTNTSGLTSSVDPASFNFSSLGEGYRMGGIAEKVPGYSSGGISRGRQSGYPAVLHGTEAVVPLPNGKSIPVEMGKGMGQSNNVVVNVNVDSNGNSQQNSQGDQGGLNLGTAIATAVQKELQNQKRSGGILNPYGAA